MRNTILVPYRNRDRDLKYFLENSYPLLKKNMDNLKIVVIEQVDGKPFNRGKTLNIGFNESYSDYYFTHVVDTNPMEETIKSIYIKGVEEDHIMGIYTSCCDTLGGIIKLRKSSFEKINGFPNNFWGWGCEDKDLQNRVEFRKLKVTKNILNDNPQKDKYFKIFKDQGDCDNRMPNHIFVYDLWKNIPYEKKEKYITNNGLSNLEYKVIKDEMIMEDVRKILVDI